MPNVDLSDVHIAILAGGSGTRLWPLSRTASPKQLLPLWGERSLLQQTMDRVLPLVSPDRVHVLTGPDYADAIAEQLPAVPRENIYIEPSPRGTAPALGLASMRLRKEHSGDSVFVSLHADHAIVDDEAFRQALIAAVVTARQGFLVTVGIVPSGPETGYGYIQRGRLLWVENNMATYRVARFTEKPPLERAQEFVTSGRYYWNTGYFSWTLDNILEEFQRLLPEMYPRLDAIMTPSLSAEQIDKLWSEITPTTIDVGIMENARKVAVVPSDMGWSDIGSWAAIRELADKDSRGNASIGSAEYYALDSDGTLVRADNKLVATIGVRDMVIVDTGDALLVMPRSRAQDVAQLVRDLRRRDLDRYL